MTKTRYEIITGKATPLSLSNTTFNTTQFTFTKYFAADTARFEFIYGKTLSPEPMTDAKWCSTCSLHIPHHDNIHESDETKWNLKNLSGNYMHTCKLPSSTYAPPTASRFNISSKVPNIWLHERRSTTRNIETIALYNQSETTTNPTRNIFDLCVWSRFAVTHPQKASGRKF